MDDIVDETDTIEVQAGNSDSRKRRITGGKRIAAIKMKYSKLYNSNVIHPCAHDTKIFRCSKVTPKHVMHMRTKLCSVPEKLAQDGITSPLIQTHQVKRRRPRVKPNKKVVSEHLFNVKYFLTVDSQRVPVCKKFFLEVTKMGRTRLQNIAKKQFQGERIKENRGGDRKSHLSREKKDNSVFGNWQEIEDIRFNWYKEVLFNTPTTIQETIDDNENECDCLDSEICMRI
ncbi:unnamed protein product [Parnassius apollo]|uniref:(apollo) hypothetical protein n=1 Tax=Parnassius apollo TaxID=110799 RepID=A0A8S3X4D7_PARAO|nr:unnamed protein product [Parnassius apollo]